jgi:hypothetical protein
MLMWVPLLRQSVAASGVLGTRPSRGLISATLPIGPEEEGMGRRRVRSLHFDPADRFGTEIVEPMQCIDACKHEIAPTDLDGLVLKMSDSLPIGDVVGLFERMERWPPSVIVGPVGS